MAKRQTSPGIRQKRWLVLVALFVLLYLAFSTGLLGRALGYARLLVHPVDHGLVSFLPDQAQGVSVSHLPFIRLPQNAKVRQEMKKFARMLRDETGIRLIFDIDSLATDESQQIMVLRGRFDAQSVAAHLQRRGFSPQTYREQFLVVHEEGREALAFVGPYLVLGPLSRVHASVDRHLDKKGLKPNRRVVKYLHAIGWKHGVFGAARLDGPAWRGTALSTLEEPHVQAAMGAVDFANGDYPLRVILEFDDPRQAQSAALQVRLMRTEVVRELRKAPESWAPALADAVEKMEITLFQRRAVSMAMVLPGEVVESWLNESTVLISNPLCKKNADFSCLDGMKNMLQTPALFPRSFAFSLLRAAGF